jgi:PAS domain S-box-containing protein
MNPEEFGARLHTFHRRLNRLAHNGAVPQDQAILEELHTALEELRVVDEELRQQNEELVSAHLQVEIERQRYQDLFQLAPDAYLVTDLMGIITEANLSSYRLLGVTPQFLAGKALAGFIANEDRPRFRNLLNRHDRSSSPQTTAFKLRPRQRELIDVELTYSVACDLESHPVAIRWIVRDVSEQRRMIQHIGALNSELEHKVEDRTSDLRAAQRLSEDLFLREQSARHAAEASDAQSRHVQKLESIGVLAGGIAHDFNNLLHVVLGNADIALGQLPRAAPAREPLEEVVRATLRAADLTRQLLAYSGKGAFVIRHIDLSSEVRDMATLLRTAISKQAVLEWELQSDLPAISADATQIRQIVMNLITNASDALGDGGGSITLRTGIVEAGELTRDHLDASTYVGSSEPANVPYVYLEVADTGVGMTADTLSRIFDPFFSTKYTGRGLGLAAVMGIVRAHSGLIRIRSDPGRGSSFRVLFPPVSEHAFPTPQPVAGQRDWRGSGTILVVDDEEGVREVAERMLQEIGFDTITAQDGREALEILGRPGNQITGLLLDLSMPRMGGVETLRRLRATHPELPVIIMSGYTEQVVAQQIGGSDPGNTGFLQKPFLAEDLVAAFRPFAEAGS